MKILYIAVHSHVGWGAEYWLRSAFESKGVACICYDYRRYRHSFRWLPWWLINQHLRYLEIREKPDVILLQRAENMSPHALEGLRAPIIFWSTEPLQLKRDVDQLLQTSLFARLFVHSYSCVEKIKEAFAHQLPKCSVMHNACPSTMIDISDTRTRFALFNRSMSERRHAWLDPSSDLIDFISGHYGDEYFADLASAQIAVNVHYSDQNLDDFESGIFEAMAKGCVVVSEQLSSTTMGDLGMRDCIIEVGSPSQLREALLQLRSDRFLIEKCRQLSFAAIQSNTWENRADQFIACFKTLTAGKHA